MIKTLIVHFQPIEYYPPTHNLLTCLSAEENIHVEVATTSNGKNRPNCNYPNTDIFRYARVDGQTSKIRRLFFTVWFNIKTSTRLLFNTYDCVVFYETWSVLPAVLSLRSKKSKNYIHFHEYTSTTQLHTNETAVFKLLNSIEKKIINKFHWVSHTNENRLSLYQKDNPELDTHRCHIMPNYPPAHWRVDQAKSMDPSHVKLVYVGSLSTKNMYFTQVASWVETFNGKLSLDIYSININSDVRDFVETNRLKHTHLKGSINYDDLPQTLKKYDVGLVLYNGGNLNYVYNAPNKLFEYYACGLDVWFSDELKTSHLYKTSDSYPKIMSVDFNDLNSFDLNHALDREGLHFKATPYHCEEVYADIIKDIKK